MRSMVFALAAAMALTIGCTVEVVPRPGVGDRPQNLAQLDYPVAGCERGPYALALMNRTDYYLDMTLDGEPIDFLAPEGSYAELPPWTTAYVCLDHLGDHDITGRSFYESYGQLYPVGGEYGYFAVTDYYGSDVGPGGRQELFIDDSLLYYY
ncbi:MAG TPA: hypothetical protein VL426_03280 [Candidatus Binatia bacterium]|jgi:hypothetical protein|nr:hypothetical protein [Candidatus Binatia bacterium]